MSPPAAPAAPDATLAASPATLDRSTAGTWVLGGAWTVNGLGALADTADSADSADSAASDEVAPLPSVVDGSALIAIDSAGAWVLQRRLRGQPTQPRLSGWPARAEGLM